MKIRIKYIHRVPTVTHFLLSSSSQGHSNFVILYFRRKGKQHSDPGYQHQEEVDKRSGPPVMNDAFCDSNDSLEVKQNANDGDDTFDDRVKEEVNNTDPDTGDVYANKESESLKQIYHI